MRFDDVRRAVAGIPNMTPEQGRCVYDHLVATSAGDVLELGTAHGVSASYMAGAVAERGGRVVTVDQLAATARRDPKPEAVLERAGVTATVERVVVADSSYTWWLKDQVRSRADDAGNVEPCFDFCYVDGAHNFTIDGLAVILVEKLLRPGGWLLLDDLDWRYGAPASTFGPGQGPDDLGLSAAERGEAHMRAVFDVLVRQHPAFTEFRVQDEQWGWAHKQSDVPRRLELIQTGPSGGEWVRRLLRRR